jgi:hypothetical protein
MLFSNTIVGLVAVAVATVQADPIKVTVGADGKLAYSPNNIIAAVGTQIEFDFFPKNHSVTQSSFANPCHPLSTGGFFSGFVPTKNSPSGTSFTITVQDTKPIWFYCGQTVGNHCQSGMVGAINAPTTGNTLDAFITLAKNATTSTSPPGGPVGGTLNTNSNSTSSSSSSTSTYTTTAVVTSATATSTIVSTWTSAGTTHTSTVGSSTLYTTSSTVSTVVAATGAATATTSGTTIQITGAASAMSANVFGAAAVVFGAMAMM